MGGPIAVIVAVISYLTGTKEFTQGRGSNPDFGFDNTKYIQFRILRGVEESVSSHLQLKYCVVTETLIMLF